MTTHRVIVLDKISPDGLALLDAAAPGIEYEVRVKLAGEELRAALAEFDGAICRSGVTITPESLEGNRRLKAIVRAGVGTDNIDKAAATRQGIVVMNTPAGNTLSTAEQTFALMLALSRNIAPAAQSMREGKWDRGKFMGTQLAEKTLGIVGMGRIGQEVAKRAVAFQMRVLGYDPFLSPERAESLGVTLVETVDEMLPQVDYLTVHTPLTPETRDLIGRPQLERLKKGVRLLNCARGGIYNEQALLEGLESGVIAGAALDVFEEEPPKANPLVQHPNVLCTPHLGASTEEAQTQVAVEAVQLLVKYLTTGEIRHAVNVAAVDPRTLAALRGYLNVAWRLGLFLAQWHEGGVSVCRLNYRGEITQRDTTLLTSAFCAGLLERALDEEVNIVNAEMLLRERGTQLEQRSRSEPGAFSSSITAEVESEGHSICAGGTIFGAEMPRLDGTLLAFMHDDVPGIIGAVGTIFGRHNVNIAQMAVGRAGDAPGGKAIGVLNLDGTPPKEAVAEVLGHPHIHRIRVMELPPAGELPSWLAG